MKRKTILFIIIITSASLLGIVITQLFWIQNAVYLQKEQFDHRVSIGIKSVVSTLMADNSENGGAELRTCQPGCGMKNEISGSIDSIKLDSLLRDEFDYLNIHAAFEFGVFHRSDSFFLINGNSVFRKEILESRHCTSLSCLWKPDAYLFSVYFLDEQGLFYKKMYGWLGLSAFFLIIVITSFSYIVLTLIRQKKLSEMKTDFVNNMTHEFKTPISTISLASEMLLKPSVNEIAEKTKKYAGIIFDENNRLKNQVEQVLQIAVLDKGEFKIKKAPIEINEIIDIVCDNFEMQVRQRDGNLVKNFEAVNSIIQADQIHFTNVIANLLDNANKYSLNKPNIKVFTRNVHNGVLIGIEDNGMGISQESQKHIFKQFYRVHTGNIHDVKGFGLGLYYVKTIVEAHGGSIKIASELKKGSRFEIFLPFE